MSDFIANHGIEKRGRIIAWVLFFSWICGVMVLSSIRGDYFSKFDVPRQVWGMGFDKIVHFGLFCAGGILLTTALHLTFRWSRKTLFMVVVCSLALFGILDELHQLFTLHRSGADVRDWIADTLGATAGWFFWCLTYGKCFFGKRKTADASTATGD